ncbi:GTPase IMAP family member 8 [Etheostoma spectabile]|uniref:GTPase IMAP family member 8 n=1 Tax=Etheostoma spectabile TaxID=54343 RepID=UPI0013AED54B|nr:GTPase IMAP family member 8-like [Etheostoma spectabile]
MNTSTKELNAVLVGSKSSRKCLVGNIILGRQAFDPRDVTSHCERGERKIFGRTVTLVTSPGWLRGYTLYHTPELFKNEAILSVTLCPPGLHSFILVINAELPFKKESKKATREHLQHFFGDKVWDHTIVAFSQRGQIGHTTIEDYITREGAPLQSLLEACGNRYLTLYDDGANNDVKVKELFEKIDALVAKNGWYEADNTLLQSTELKRKGVAEKAEELRLQSQQQRQELRNLLTEPAPNLKILMVGWVFSGKSLSGNTILSAEDFHSGDRTVKALKRSGEVGGREVVIVDTPGWWKFFPAMFTPWTLRSEILNGVSLCSPSPNVILLAVPVDTSFTDEQRRVTESNMRLLGQRVWRHVIVLFTFGDAMGYKTIEQHIESEGKALRWLIEKCGNRYHVLDNTSNADDQVTELLQKMEEMVAGNSSFYISRYPETGNPHTEEDDTTESKDENTTKEITEQLFIEWDRNNWEKHYSHHSMASPLNMSEDKQTSGSSEGEKEQMEHRHEDDFETYFGASSKGDAASGPLNRWMGLLEREWSRREVAMEQAWTYFYKDGNADSEPDRYRLLKSREKVRLWLKTQHTSSALGTDSGIDSNTIEKSEEEILREDYRKTVERH